MMHKTRALTVLPVALLSVLVAITFVGVSPVDSKAAHTAGMNCKTTNEFKYCEGKSGTYHKTETQVAPQSNNKELQTRVQTNAGSKPGYGFLPRSRCDANNRDKCQQLNPEVVPTFLINDRGQPRYILQLGAIQQRLRLSICTGSAGSRCGNGRGTCDQQFATVQLLAWNPDARSPQLFVDRFRVPSCCRCGHSGPYWPGSHRD